MKIIIIPDLHGDRCWSDILMKESFDLAVFLGDYLDSRIEVGGNVELENLNHIIDLKKNHPERVFLLIGNHEYHYTESGFRVGEKSPRFQPQYADAFKATLFENRDLFQMAYKNNQYLFTHAGVTESWLGKYSSKIDCNSIDKTINETWRKEPDAFALTAEGRAHDWGDDVWQSPIWVRPQSLQSDSENFRNEIIQVVGHTPKPNIEISEQEDQRYFFVDTFRYSKEYLVIENGCALVSNLHHEKV